MFVPYNSFLICVYRVHLKSFHLWDTQKYDVWQFTFFSWRICALRLSKRRASPSPLSFRSFPKLSPKHLYKLRCPISSRTYAKRKKCILNLRINVSFRFWSIVTSLRWPHKSQRVLIINIICSEWSMFFFIRFLFFSLQTMCSCFSCRVITSLSLSLSLSCSYLLICVAFVDVPNTSTWDWEVWQNCRFRNRPLSTLTILNSIFL
jgi:hypothetical protein